MRRLIAGVCLLALAAGCASIHNPPATQLAKAIATGVDKHPLGSQILPVDDLFPTMPSSASR